MTKLRVSELQTHSAADRESASHAGPSGQDERARPVGQEDAPPSYTEATSSYTEATSSTTSRSPVLTTQSSYGASTAASSSSTKRGNPSSTYESEAQVLSRALQFTKHEPPPTATHHRLPNPVAIPQVASGLGLPFARAYSPALNDRGVPMAAFLDFIDNLNVVCAASPPTQVLDSVGGGGVSFVPHHVSSHACGGAFLSDSRSAVFLERAFGDFFAPRGLRVELATSDALKVRAGLAPDAPLVHPLERSEGLGMHERRMRALDGFVAPLTFDVPPLGWQNGVFERVSAADVERLMGKGERKAVKDRRRAMEKAAERQADEVKARRELERELAKIDRERTKVELEAHEEFAKKPKEASKIEEERVKELGKLKKEVDKAWKDYRKEANKCGLDYAMDDTEPSRVPKLLWIVIEDL